MEKLIDDRPLGIYADQDGHFRSEYQVGRRLIWVRCQHQKDCLACVRKVDGMMPGIWAAMPDVVALAQDYSRIVVPEFWIRHDMSRREGDRLGVWGITITPDLGLARFYVGENLDFDYASPTFSKDDYWDDTPILLPKLPDQHRVYVLRDGDGVLRVDMPSL